MLTSRHWSISNRTIRRRSFGLALAHASSDWHEVLVTKSHIARASRPGFGLSPRLGLRPEFGSRPRLGLRPRLAQGLVLALVLGVVVTLSPTPLRAQQSGGGWFVPPQTPAAGAPGQSRPQPGAPRQAPPAEAAGPQPVGPPGTEPMMPM